MVSQRCKLMVQAALEELHIPTKTVDLGVAVIDVVISPQQRSQFAIALKKIGLELIDSKKSILIEKIKNTVIELIRFSEKRFKKKFSSYLAEKLNYSYTYLSNLFSREENTTIEQYIIKQKIERVKELIMDDEMTLTEIAFELQYSSVSHLSGQFKKITGMTPTFFKRLRFKKRLELQNV